jgi:hypothetical protein
VTDQITPGLLRYSGLRWRLGGAFIDGGQSVFGESQTRRTDGGGRWFAEFGNVQVMTTAQAQLYEALLLDWNNGNEKVIVHRLAGPLLAGRDAEVTFSDDTTFSDGSPLISGEVNAEFTASAALRATAISIRVWGASAFQGGEAFTVVHPTMEDRLYGVARVLSSTSADEYTDYTLRISPPLREAVADGDQIDFNRPRCVMRVDVSDENLWPTFEPGFFARTSIRFSETFKL